ncbi:DUF2786 domain-containing protein [Magnetospirillum sp. UT-4]|uniref:DUF2786 domain-containing protein n=1 Tax=Magnetospirillum sp. UT-4 TaxID=2681467 RepID=UPI001382F0AC|nr:DUF2786 domain-containing protein [Magnetospirillum sp. UT-4]CAA7612200.1 Membrane protein related to metalloendopeptidase [Magnetospirillum sp. UT-4]
MDVQKLAKVLALAASDNESEALHALRTAKRLLDGHGADFVELSRRLAESGPPSGETEALEDAVFDLRNEIRHLRAENERLRQGRATVPGADAPSFMDAAKDAAAAIRLRAELADRAEELDAARTELLRLKAHEATMREQFREALSEAGRLGVRLSEAETRRQRLEAENRRLTHANHALTVELNEIRSERGRLAAELVAVETRQDAAGKTARRPTKRRAKAGQAQYALL